MKAKFTNKYRIRYILPLFITLFLVSCGNSEEASNTHINMSLVSYANNSFSDILSFKVVVYDSEKVVLETSKCSDRSSELGFNIGDGLYTFELSGYSKADCSGDLDWKGDSTVEIKKNIINNVKIPVGKVGEFTLSSIEMQDHGAFMDAIQVNEKIILSGGISSINKNLKRLTSDSCEKGDANCVCISESSCYQIVTPAFCESQGMSEDDCTRCLAVSESDKNSFNEKSVTGCLIETCPINIEEGNACNLRGRTSVQYLDIKNLHSDLESLEGDYIRLSETRIFHKSYYLNDKLYFIGGAPEAILTNTSPFITLGKYRDDQRNMIDIYGVDGLVPSDIKENTINVDFNIVPNGDSFSIFGGRVGIGVDPDSFNQDIVTCKSSCFLDNNAINPIFNIGGGFATTGIESFNLGGISLDDSNSLDGSNLYKYKNDFSSFNPKDVSNNLDIYKPKVFYSESNNELYLIGGLKFNKDGFDLNFTNEFNNSVLVFDTDGTQTNSFELPSALQNVVFSSIVEYTHNTKKGLLFVGGLKKDNNVFKAIDTVYFISFEDLNNANLAGFKPLSKLNKARFAHSVVVDDSNKVWVIGGLSENITQDDTIKNDFVVDGSIEIFIE